ncbi:sensor histidine kinase [Sphingomonas rubra]|uniref:histidine kinase n=1 Tax=Sphingomonas rubra TaxID=634430 RepID=A0A1I5PK62_9SPHN|nr:sensor histidine kinase [Sphingomonas rubra]SFP34508.1 Histidine kinase [Sphingomonas rubra]
MSDIDPAPQPDDAPLPRSSRIARWPTGAKLFLILSAALLPLALIAVFATLQTSRLADAEARARLRIAAAESGRAIAIELVGDMTALRVAVNALGIDPTDAASCARAQGVFAQQASAGARFEIAGRDGRLLCGTRLPATDGLPDGTAFGADILPARGVVLSVEGARDDVSARAFFPRDVLRRLGQPTSRATSFASALIVDGEALPLEPAPAGGVFQRLETMETPLGIADLRLQTSVRSAPITSSLVIALLLPLLMWAAAAGIAWLVVDRLLLRPLRRLRAGVAAYTPGTVIDPRGWMLPTQEISDLADTFRTLSRTVADHEEGLEEGLRRQTKLTREVHHRVKNNLQVISSLINFHARGARSADATAAYASIQRRVDALAVVHRHHFAELEEHRGLNLRTLIGELASNLRATASEQQHMIGLTLDVDPFLVNQDVAVAVAFLVTEAIELAAGCDPAAQIRVSVKPADTDTRAVLRVVSRALVDGDTLRDLAGTRYGRVMEGLSRQLRSKLHHDPLTGAYEIAVAVIGRD